MVIGISLTKESLLDYYCSFPVAVCLQLLHKIVFTGPCVSSVEDGTNM